MIKTAISAITIFLILLFPVAQTVYAHDMLGLEGKEISEHNYGKPDDVDWDPDFEAQAAADQAAIIAQVSQYDSWFVDRSIQIRITEIEGKNKKETGFFLGMDLIVPGNIKCEEQGLIAIVGTIIDINKQKTIQRDGRDIQIISEYTAVIYGQGWNCEKDSKPFWLDENSRIDPAVIDEYLKKTKDLKAPDIEPDINSSYFIDLGLGQFKDQLEDGKKFVEESKKEAQASPKTEAKESANTCSFTDPSDDGYALVGGGKDKLPARGELVSVNINKRSDDSEVTFSTKGDIPKDGSSGGASFTMALVTESGAPKFPAGHIWQGADAVVTFHTTKTDYEGSMFILADNGQQVGIPFKPEYSVNGNTAKFTIPKKTVPPDKLKNMTILWEVTSNGENFIDSIPEGGGKVTCQ